MLTFSLALCCLTTTLSVTAPDTSMLESKGQTPLAGAVQTALVPAAIRRGGTTPRAAVMTADNELGTLAVGTREVVAAVEDAIAAAQHEILLQVYQWVDDDEAATRVRHALDARLARAVLEQETMRVGLIVGDAKACEHSLAVGATINMLASHAAANAQLRIEVLGYKGTLFDILHTKTVIIDGRTAIVSTANFYTHGGIDKDSFNMAAPLRGPVVAALMQDWHHARHHAQGLWQRGLTHVSYLPSEDAQWLARAREQQDLPSLAGAPPFLPVQQGLQASVLSRPARNIYLDGGANNPQAQGLLALFRNAKHHIKAINPALNVPAYKDALVDAIVLRDVEVHLLLSYHMNRRRQHWLMGGDNADTALELYNRLLARGGERAADKLHLYFGVDSTGALAAPASAGNIHAKVASFDGDALLIGSTNWDWPSYNSARELSVALFGPGVATSFERDVFSHRLGAARPIVSRDLPDAARRKQAPAARYLESRE